MASCFEGRGNKKLYYFCSLSWLLLLFLGFITCKFCSVVIIYKVILIIMLYFKVMNAHSHFVYFIFSVLNCLLWCKSFNWNLTNSSDFFVLFCEGGDRFSRALMFISWIHACLWIYSLCLYLNKTLARYKVLSCKTNPPYLQLPHMQTYPWITNIQNNNNTTIKHKNTI